jgi:HipA-like protein
MNFADYFKKLFQKSEDEITTHLPLNESIVFVLMVDNIKIATLSANEGKWIFKYSDEFKKLSEEYNRITGFSDLNKTYTSQVLWPFFQIRIPGLNQPAVQEILEKENIEKDNEVALLKRFGRQSISNPYLLVPG